MGGKNVRFRETGGGLSKNMEMDRRGRETEKKLKEKG